MITLEVVPMPPGGYPARMTRVWSGSGVSLGFVIEDVAEREWRAYRADGGFLMIHLSMDAAVGWLLAEANRLPPASPS